MRVLLDTHAAIWWWTNDRRLSKTVLGLLGGDGCEVFISAITAMEIATKSRIGKLPELPDPPANFARSMRASGFLPLALTPDHAMMAGSFPQGHRDPFDRLLAAQSVIENIPLVTRDAKIAPFGCEVIW